MNPKQIEDSDEVRREVWNYPYLPLSSALKVSEAVKELGGARSDVPKSALAKHLGESERSPTFSQRITAAKAYGLLYGRGEYGLTELGKRYYFPTSDSDKSAALLEIFSSPAAFKEVIRRFDGGSLPNREILSNIFHRELGVPESWKDRVAAFFSNAAQFVGAIDEKGFLRYRAAFHSGNLAEAASVTEDVAPRSKTTIAHKFYGGMPLTGDNSAMSMNVWSFSHGGKFVRLETPIDLDKDLWQKLNAYVQLLKPIGLDMA